MKKKVLFMIDSLTCGGAEKSLVSLLPLLNYDKVDVTLMLVGRGGVFESYVPRQVRVITYTPGAETLLQKVWLRLCRMAFSILLRVNKYRHQPLNSPTMEWMTCSTAIRPHKEHYDVAIAYQQGFPCWYVLEKVSADKKYAWINVDITKTKFRLGYVKRFYDRYDGVIAVSNALYEIILKIGLVDKKRLHCVYDILNQDLIRRQGSEPFGGEVPDKHVVTIVTVARLMLQNKGQDLCIEASKILQNKGYRFQWFFVGDGPSRQEIERLAKERGVDKEIRLVGMQPNPYSYIQAADVYVQSSRYEGFGLTVTEAKILGRAIVCTNFPTAFNQLENEKNGLIVEMTAQQIADGVERLIKDKALAQRLAQAAGSEVNTTSVTEAKKVMEMILA